MEDAESIIPVSQIILSTRIVEMVKKYIPDFEENGYKVVKDGSFPLNTERLVRILEGIEKGVKIPAIDLEPKKIYVPPHKRRKKGKNPLYFTIINGRHRVAAALIKNKSHIRAKLVA